MRLKIHWASFNIVQRKFMSVICSKFSPSGRRSFLNSTMRVLCLYGPRKILTSKKHYTVTLFDCNHLAYVIVLWQMQKFMCYCTVFALFYFESGGNF